MSRLGGLLALSALALGGCAVAPPEGGVAAAGLERWTLSGKLAVRHPAERIGMSVHWRQSGERYRIDLSGPFGAGAAVIEGRPGRVQLATADGLERARSPERLLARTLGWSLPVSAARWWVRGLPAPGPGRVTARDEAGRMARLEQFGWSVVYERWTLDDGFALPTRIRMRRGELVLKLVVADWKPGEAPGLEVDVS